MRCVDGDRWTCSTPVHVPMTSSPVHLCWCTSNYDLLIVDSEGRIQITGIGVDSTPVNHFVAAMSSDQRPRPMEFDAIVCTHCLGPEKPLIVPASAENLERLPGDVNPSSHNWDSVKPTGPFHPVKGKGVFLCVNGNGMLRLLAQSPESAYQEVEIVLLGAELLSHAVFVPQGDSLLLFTHSRTGVIRVYNVVLSWSARANSKPTGSLEVQVKATPIASMDANVLSMGQLQILKTVTTPTVVRHQNPSGTARSHSNVQIKAIYDNAQASTKVTYFMAKQPQKLHDNFFRLSGDQLTSNLAPTYEWKIVVVNIETGLERIRALHVSDTWYCYLFESGRLEYVSLIPSARLLSDVNLRFSEELCKQFADSDGVAFSPNSSCAVLLPLSSTANDNEGSKRSKAPFVPQLQLVSNQNGELDQQKISAICNVISALYAYSYYNNSQSDDLVYLCWFLLHRDFPGRKADVDAFFNTLITESRRLLNVSLLVPEDGRHAERLVVVPSSFQRWLSLMMSLGTTANWRRTPGSLMAWTLLNIQILAFAVTWTLKVTSQQSKAQTKAQQLNEINLYCYHITNLFGLIRWLTDLVSRISQEIYLASVYASPPPDFSFDAATYALSQKPNVLISLILSNVARFRLLYALRGLRGLGGIIKRIVSNEQKLLGKAETSVMMLRRYDNVLMSSIVPLSQFEMLLGEADRQVKLLYIKSNMPENIRQLLDLDLLKCACCPKVLLPVVSHVVRTFSAYLHEKVDIPRLHFYDTAWLAIDEFNDQSNKNIDGVRKRIMSTEDVKRFCSRCNNRTVVEPQKTLALTQWTLLYHRSCLCGGIWLSDQPNVHPERSA